MDVLTVLNQTLKQRRQIFPQNKSKLSKVCAFCMWSCAALGILMPAAFLTFSDRLLAVIGASTDTWEPAKTYLAPAALGVAVKVAPAEPLPQKC